MRLMANEPTSPPTADRAPLRAQRSIPIPDSVLADLVAHAAAAAHNVGHLDDSPASDAGSASTLDARTGLVSSARTGEVR